MNEREENKVINRVLERVWKSSGLPIWNLSSAACGIRNGVSDHTWDVVRMRVCAPVRDTRWRSS